MKHITNSVNKLDRLENYNFLPFLFAKQPAIGRPQVGADGEDRQQREPGASLSNQIQVFHIFVLKLKQIAAKLREGPGSNFF